MAQRLLAEYFAPPPPPPVAKKVVAKARTVRRTMRPSVAPRHACYAGSTDFFDPTRKTPASGWQRQPCPSCNSLGKTLSAYADGRFHCFTKGCDLNFENRRPTHERLPQRSGDLRRPVTVAEMSAFEFVIKDSDVDEDGKRLVRLALNVAHQEEQTTGIRFAMNGLVNHALGFHQQATSRLIDASPYLHRANKGLQIGGSDGKTRAAPTRVDLMTTDDEMRHAKIRERRHHDQRRAAAKAARRAAADAVRERTFGSSDASSGRCDNLNTKMLESAHFNAASVVTTVGENTEYPQIDTTVAESSRERDYSRRSRQLPPRNGHHGALDVGEPDHGGGASTVPVVYRSLTDPWRVVSSFEGRDEETLGFLAAVAIEVEHRRADPNRHEYATCSIFACSVCGDHDRSFYGMTNADADWAATLRPASVRTAARRARCASEHNAFRCSLTVCHDCPPSLVDRRRRNAAGADEPAPTMCHRRLGVSHDAGTCRDDGCPQCAVVTMFAAMR